VPAGDAVPGGPGAEMLHFLPGAHHRRPWPARYAWAGVRSPARPTCESSTVGAAQAGARAWAAASAPQASPPRMNPLGPVGTCGVARPAGRRWPLGPVGARLAGPPGGAASGGAGSRARSALPMYGPARWRPLAVSPRPETGQVGRRALAALASRLAGLLASRPAGLLASRLADLFALT
jgi:hypothetical protein